jgi:membrane protease YdiL (CAAX protease family)
MVANGLVSALANLIVLGGLPFLFYVVYHKWRHARPIREIARRAGLQLGPGRYLLYSAACALVAVAALVLRPPPTGPFVRDGSPQQAFAGMGLGGAAVLTALLYGVVKTGFPEELLFRGLIGGSLSRRLPLVWANLGQAVVFLLPHLLVLKVMPELWGILPVIFVAALFLGWVRIKSGSMVGPWLAHAASNVAICLSVAARTVP